MRAMIWIVGALLFSLSQVASLGCGETVAAGNDGDCLDGACECTRVDSCGLDCVDTVGCEASCTSTVNVCAATCTAEDCRFRCRSADICTGLCGDNCDALCSSVDTTCRVETGAGSRVACLNVHNCAIDLGDDSTLECRSTDTCVARCVGTCTVICVGSGSCNAQCETGAGDRRVCDSGLITCGLPCP